MVVGSKTRNFDNGYAWDITICTSGTRPTAYDGRPIYETDTDKFLIYNGSSWEEVGGAGATDHGALTGLADDDHTQYYNSARHTKAIHDTLGLAHSSLSNLAWSLAGHTINATIDMNNNNITDLNELWFNTSDPGIKFDTGDFIWFDTSEDRIYFEIGSTNICYLRSTGIHPVLDDTYNLGSGSSYWNGVYATSLVVEDFTHISGDGSGNMELHVATGKTVKIVVG